MTEPSELFRRPALERHRVRVAGEVTLPHPPGFRMATLMLLIVSAAAIAFAATATYARRETVSGWVVPDAGLVRVKARRAGVLERLDVAEGQHVASGQQIAIIRVPNDLSDGDANDQLAESLARQTTYRSLEAEAAIDVLERELSQVRAQSVNLDEEIIEAERRVGLQQERVALGRAEYTRVEGLAAQGFFPRAEVANRRAALLSVEQEHSQLKSALLSARRQKSDLSARLDSLPRQIAAGRASAGQDTEGLAQQRTQLRSQQTHVVRAQTSGRISALAVRAGQAVSNEATIAVITPEGSTLEAELFVPSRGVGFVRSGQDVRLMIDAFPYQKFGVSGGRIAHVSSTVVAPGEIEVPGVELREPVFRARVALHRPWVEAYGARAPLQAGMLFRADIIVERRSLLEWLLDPLYAAGRR